jgi:two-component system, cell cycle response regulator DivK
VSKRILVIEDQDNRQILRDLLTSADFEVIEAADGETGLATAAAARRQIQNRPSGPTGSTRFAA